MSGSVPRRLSRRTVLGGSMVALMGAGGCAMGGGAGSGAPVSPRPTTADNPFGVVVDQPVEFFNFEGGYGHDWFDVPVRLYNERFPNSKLAYKSSQDLPKELQPRFVDGTPPDLIGNVGLDTAGLVKQGRLVDLGPVLDAPAYDTEGKTVAETLLPGVAGVGVYDGKRYSVPSGYGLNGVWYSNKLMTEHGWTYPETFDAMLALCAEIKQAGLAPWTYQGKYPGYMWGPIMGTAEKAAGPQLGVAVDNLEPGAWQQEALVESAAKYGELFARGYILDGTAGLTHTQAQTYWAQGKAVFIPCGAWLENELGDIAPKDLQMSAKPAPGLGAGDALPFAACNGGPGGDLLVAADAPNPGGGMELLRAMLSVEASRRRIEVTRSLGIVKGAGDGADVSYAMTSMNDMIAAAGDDVGSYWMFGTWYQALQKEVDNATGALLTGSVDAAGWAARIQKKADAIAADSSVTKYRREAK
ncbi:N-acetylglucosamine/diacetylchitobiose ABC transporter substrate-binding protein [Microlunatus speluncae]|uniref:N-acetylglucosamine/diacetylchitobiose ABC transporter substrate-binding protein n=1 Tax=Microlunatus speluncae TaxID=2594267 RepID=UPI00126625D1|nr:N-acetylglucosamine/diacetylchitobiose ABC transporter substrate-binding protein [Microlunatus speluncae]